MNNDSLYVEPSLYFVEGQTDPANRLYWWIYHNGAVVQIHSDFLEAERSLTRILFSSDQNMTAAEVQSELNRIVTSATDKLRKAFLDSYEREYHRAGLDRMEETT